LVGSHAVEDTQAGEKCVEYLTIGFKQISEALNQLSKFNFSRAIKALNVIFGLIHDNSKMK